MRETVQESYKTFPRKIDGRSTVSKVYALAEDLLVYHKDGLITPGDVEYLILHTLYLSDFRTIRRIFQLLEEFYILVPAQGATRSVRRSSSYRKDSSNGSQITYRTTGQPYAFSAYVLGPAARGLGKTLGEGLRPTLSTFIEKPLPPSYPPSEIALMNGSSGEASKDAEEICVRAEGEGYQLTEHERLVLGLSVVPREGGMEGGREERERWSRTHIYYPINWIVWRGRGVTMPPRIRFNDRKHVNLRRRVRKHRDKKRGS